MLTEEQKKQAAQWFAAGASLAEMQKRISEEFGVDMTYLDVRLFVADLPQPAEPEVPENPEIPEKPENPEVPETPEAPENPEPPEGSEAADAPSGALSVTVDPLAPPGIVACGSVTFSDGVSGKWMLDQMGRLGFSGLPQGYRPSQEDSMELQPRLVEALRAKGLA